MKVWIDQDLCTGDGLCEEIAPSVFTLLDDGLAYVKEGDKIFGLPKVRTSVVKIGGKKKKAPPKAGEAAEGAKPAEGAAAAPAAKLPSPRRRATLNSARHAPACSAMLVA